MKTLWMPSLLGAASLLSVALLTQASDRAPVSGGEPSATEVAAPPLERVVQRANTFMASTQDDTALAADGSGNWVVVWHSRRQEGGTYGVYARRFDPTGNPLSAETRINATVAGMQMQPCVAADDQGGMWFAWRSFHQDGDEGGIVVRRFDAPLERATGEVIVNTTTRGHQSDPSIAALPGGGALVVWTGPATDGEGGSRGEGVFGRRLAPDGSPDGPEFRIDGSTGRAHLPHVASDALGRAVVCWARTDESGTPNGIFARIVDSSGSARGEEFRVDPSTSIQPVEPTLSVTSEGEFAIAWLDLRGDGDPLLWRAYRRDGDRVAAGALHEHAVAEPGYTNGHAIDLVDDGSLLVAWSRNGGRQAGTHLFAQVFDRDGGERTTPFRVHDLDEGVEKLAVGRGTSRARLLDDGRMGFAWHGDGGLGDSTGAHISVLVPPGFESGAGEASGEPSGLDDTFWEAAEEGAAPHEPPVFDPRAVEERPPATAPLLGPGGSFDFLGIPNTGWTPPDPHMAVSSDHVVLMTNGAIAYFDTSGQFLFQDQIEGAGGFWGSLGAQSFVFDPEVIWDHHAGRFIAMAAERADASTQPYYLLAISDDADPNGPWHLYRINVLASAGDTDIDSPNLAVDENVIYLTSDFFGPDMFHVYMIDKASVLNGGTIAFTDLTISGEHSFGVPMTYDVGAPAQYMIHADENVNSNQVDLWAITDPLTSPQTQSTTLTLPITYSHPEDAPQKGTSNRIELFEARFWSCVYRNGSLWATHHSGSSHAIQRWYQIDMRGWPTSGNQPLLVQSGSINLGFPIRTYYGSIAVDANDNVALTFARSSPTEFISMAQASRGANDPLGVMQPMVSVALSNGPAGNRWGDYSACVPDPDEPEVFWAHHEYLTAGSWKTRVARFRACPLGEPYCVAALHSGGGHAQIGSTGTPRLPVNDFHLTISDGPAGKFGLFYYGPNQIQVPFGAGFRCVGGQTQRINPVLMTSAGGTLDHRVELTAPTTAQITPGSSWNFQFWFRDPMGPGGFDFNLSNGLAVTFCE